MSVFLDYLKVFLTGGTICMIGQILIDKTNRKESSDALAKLDGKEKDAYLIDITENKIVILGK